VDTVLTIETEEKMAEQVGKHYVLLNDERRSGGLSTVRKAVDTRDGSSVAVKFIVAPSDELTRKVFDRETRALRSLSHPNIVRFRDADVDETGTYYIVLDWVERNLVDLLEAPSWEGWGDLYDSIAAPLLDGLAHAHLKQLEHRDIKPGNILIEATGAPKLADFGIAKIRGEQLHSELTVQNFRSGPYAPPEFDSPIPYVRDVYSMGVVLLQCLSADTIRDFPDVRRALEAVNVPTDVRSLLEACVDPEPSERPANGSDLAGAFRKIASQRLARQERPKNPIWLGLHRSAREHLAGAPGDRAAAAAKLQADLNGEVFAHYGLDRETGRRDRSMVLLIGSEHRYTLRSADRSAKFNVTAAPALEYEVLEGGRRNGMAVPDIFSWTVHDPAVQAPSARAQEKLLELLDDHYHRLEHPESEEVEQVGDEIFDQWLRVLEAREELARGEHKPLNYTKVRVEGRRSTFTLPNDHESDLIGTDWEILDHQSGRRFGHGEVIDQDADQLTLLTGRPLGGLPPMATLVPYDAPSAISLNRQRNAVLAVRAGTVPGQDLRPILVEPATNAEPREVEITNWSAELDSLKKRAVQLALGARDVLVIQGPPGTGKTRFITEAVVQFLEQNPGSRILIASQTHVAVDNAVERLRAAKVPGLVRLAGADESVVDPSVRDLLLDKQTRIWADSVRARAEASVEAQASSLGVRLDHLRASMCLEQLAAVTAERERIEEHIADRAAAGTNGSDLETAIEDENPTERYQARLDQLADRRQELVAAAQSHLAGDLTIPSEIGSAEARNAIELLLGSSPEVRTLLERLQLQATWLERIGAEDSLTSIFLAGTSVVAGTCTGFLRNKAVGQLEFDLCIVDEASKATLTEALVPMSRAKRWILVGDTRQLPPTDEDLLRATNLLIEHGLTKDNITETLFQRLVDKLPEHSQLMLVDQYRMIRPIGDLISTCFYEDKLRSPKTEGLSGYEQVMGRAVTWIDTGPLGDRRRETQGVTSYANRAEAQLLVAQLARIDGAIDFGLIKLPDGRSRLEVLAIAPYKSQVEELRRRLAPRTFRHLAVTVMSVDAVQGREADLALLSLTRSNDQGKLGFLGADYWRRINVALSRARFGLTILGDAAFIRGTNGALRTVLEYIEQHPDSCNVRLADHD
jgi:hypothetical protein